MAATCQLFGRVDAGNADIFFLVAITPSLGGQPPADYKKRRLDAILIENIGQGWSRISPFAAEKDVRSRAIIEGKGNELAGLQT
jgi:hypothetical protein